MITTPDPAPTPEQSPSAGGMTDRRKADHIRINLEEDVSFKGLTTGLENYFFMHQALPEIDYEDIDTAGTLFGKRLKTPLLISSMTGGTAEALKINRDLATAAEAAGLAMGLGSQRAALEDQSLVESFQVRRFAPTTLIFANIGAVQLNYGYDLSHFQRAVDMCGADAIYLHLNVLQEAVQPEGDRNFAGLLPKIETLCRQLQVPVIAKEVGWGISIETARQLVEAGISAIDVAGAGGTSWSQVEMHRAPTERRARVAGAFIDWGIPTAYSIQYCRKITTELPVFASGGIRSGIDIAKCIALGANLGGIAGSFLKAVVRGGAEGAVELAETVTDELRVAMLCAGARDLPALSRTPLYSSFNTPLRDDLAASQG